MKKYKCPICGGELINKDLDWLYCDAHKYKISLEMYRDLIKFFEEFPNKLAYEQTNSLQNNKSDES